MEFIRSPFRIRYWVIYHNPHKRIVVVRSRLKPGNAYDFSELGTLCLDGPFDSQEDAVHALNFWRAQYRNTNVRI